jgi:alanine dehydrogenase
VAGAAAADPVLGKGLTTLGGQLVSRPVAQAHDLPFKDPADVLPTGLRGSKEP